MILVSLSEFYRHSEFHLKYSFSSPQEYTDLFNDSAKQRTSLYVTNIIKGRNPISEYVFDSGYSVLIYKISVPGHAILDSALRQGTHADLPFDGMYSSFSVGQLNLYFSWDSVLIANNIILTIYGDSVIHVFKSDSVSCLKLELKRLIIQNGKDRKTDIKLEGRNGWGVKVPVELVFVRGEAGLFIVFISPMAKSGYLQDDLPRRILKKNFFKQ